MRILVIIFAIAVMIQGPLSGSTMVHGVIPTASGFIPPGLDCRGNFRPIVVHSKTSIDRVHDASSSRPVSKGQCSCFECLADGLPASGPGVFVGVNPASKLALSVQMAWIMRGNSPLLAPPRNRF
jgi:hypothetical protein